VLRKHALRRRRSWRTFHDASLSHGSEAGRVEWVSPVGPLTKKFHSGAEISPLESCRKIEVQTCREREGSRRRG
jgi:hypothetical protein